MHNAYFGREKTQPGTQVFGGDMVMPQATLSEASVNHLGALGNSLTVPWNKNYQGRVTLLSITELSLDPWGKWAEPTTLHHPNLLSQAMVTLRQLPRKDHRFPEYTSSCSSLQCNKGPCSPPAPSRQLSSQVADILKHSKNSLPIL